MAVHRTRTRARVGAVSLLALALGATACTDMDALDPAEGATPVEAPAEQLTAATVAASTADLDEIVADVMAATDIPGVAVAVVHDGEVVHTQGYGVKDTGGDDPVDAETVFQLASLSKPIGATAVAGVVGDGAIAWDDPVVGELPDFQLSEEYVTRNVTVADFYSHRSGLPGGIAGNDLEAMGFDQATILERLRELPLAPFRAVYSYSNFGMTVGGLAAASAYGAPFADMAQQVLFTPAGMTSSSFSYDEYVGRENKALIHAKANGEYTPSFTRNADAQAPAGGASSNAVDLSRWMLLQLEEGQLDGEQVIDAEALAETKRPHMNQDAEGDPAQPSRQYALGWNVSQAEFDPSLLQWGHSGAFSQGAGTTVRILPQLDLGVVVLTNAQPVGGAEAIADAYLDTLLNGEPSQDWTAVWAERFAPILTPPTFEEPAEPTEARESSAYVGEYANGYYGTVRISEGADGLEMAWGPDGATTLPLEHFDGDVFLYVDSPEIEGALTPLTFQFDDGDTASSLVLAGVEVEGPWMELTRTS